MFFFLALTVFRLKGHIADSITLALAIAAAIPAFHMPADMAFTTAGYGFLYGLWPIAWIIVTAVFLYKLTVKSDQFEVIRSSVLSITDDQRLQVLLIGFSFGAFLKGAVGFGTPVAITAALLVGLGFNPPHAADLCLTANIAPAAFSALGIPIIVAGQMTGTDAFKTGAMTGRQLPFLSILAPFWLVFMIDDWHDVREAWSAATVVGGSLATTQYLTFNFIGLELPDITSALVSLVSLTLLLEVRQSQGASEALTASGGVAVAGGGYGGQRSVKPSVYSSGETLKAWSPFLVLTVLVTIWILKPFKVLFAPGGELYWLVFSFAIPRLGQPVVKGAPIATSATPIAAIFKFDPIFVTGTTILLSTLIPMFILRIGARIGITTFKEVLMELKWPILSIGIVLTSAFVANYSGMSTTLALVLAGTGATFPFFSPFLGWLGVLLTGSDTFSSALFSSLQSTTAHRIGVSDTLLVVANTSGGVTGKMVSPQSIAVVYAAIGMVGKESDLFRFTLKHSLIFAVLAGLITLAQAYLFTGMLVH